jgi:hypothetical protein
MFSEGSLVFCVEVTILDTVRKVRNPILGRNFSAIVYIAVRIHVMFDYMNNEYSDDAK